MKRRLGLALGLVTLAAMTRAQAQLPPEGQPIRTNRYSIDLFQGPVLASTRVTGLAGAFVAMAEGVVIVEESAGPIVGTAIHDGHKLRPECAALMALDDAVRLREEDPFTARIAAMVPTRLVVTRSDQVGKRRFGVAPGQSASPGHLERDVVGAQAQDCGEIAG